MGHSDITDFFLEDATEHLQNINDDLLTLETNQTELGLVDKIFRSIHAIKGSAGMAGFHVTSQLAHKIEDLLGQMRSQELPVSNEVVDLLFQGIDALTHEVDNISDDEGEDESLLTIFVDLREDFLKQAGLGTGRTAAEPAAAPRKPSPTPGAAPRPQAAPPSKSTPKPTPGPRPAARKASPKPSLSPLELADQLIRQAHLEKAVAVYQKLLRDDPGNAMLRQRLAETKALHAYIQKHS